MSLDFENFDRRDCTIITKAVKTGDPENVQKVISGLKELGENITDNLHTTDRQGYTAIHHAVLQAHPSILQQLLVYADERCINTESYDRTTSLLLLCQQDDSSPEKEEKLKSLLGAGANPNLPKEDPFALPLLCVLEQKWWRGAEMLLRAGADPWRVDFEHNGWAPIYYATARPDIVQLILTQGGCEPRMLHQLIGHVLPPIPKEKMLQLYNMMLPYYSDGLSVELLLLAARKPYVDIVIHMLPLVEPTFASNSQRGVMQFLQSMFRTLITLSPLDQRRFLSAYFTSLKKEIFGICDSGFSLMPLLWTCRTVDSLKILLEEAECSGLPTADWSVKPEDVPRLTEYFMSKPACSHCSHIVVKEDVNFDLLRATAHTTSILPCFRSNFLMLLRAGFKPSMHTLATYIEHTLSVSKGALSPMPNFSLLSEISRNCCASHTCWFRKPFILNTFEKFLLCTHKTASHSSCLLALLYLGVDVRDITCFLHDTRLRRRLRPDVVRVLDFFDPARTASTLYLSNNRTVKTPRSILDQSSNPSSLKHFSRLALRSALGHCRIEEKLANLKNVVPVSLRDYVCFKGELERLVHSRPS